MGGGEDVQNTKEEGKERKKGKKGLTGGVGMWYNRRAFWERAEEGREDERGEEPRKKFKKLS